MPAEMVGRVTLAAEPTAVIGLVQTPAPAVAAGTVEVVPAIRANRMRLKRDRRATELLASPSPTNRSRHSLEPSDADPTGATHRGRGAVPWRPGSRSSTQGRGGWTGLATVLWAFPVNEPGE